MLPLHEWLLLCSICALGAMTPGVSLAVITRHTLHGGARAGALAGTTHALGVGFWALVTASGMVALFQRYPGLELILSLIGAVFLIWLAIKSWQAAHQALPATPSQALHGAARDGFLIAFLNPKVALFFLALFSQFLRADMGDTARAQVVVTAAVIDGGWYCLVALMLGRSRLLPWLREHHHWVERGSAVLLAAIAVSVIVRAAL